MTTPTATNTQATLRERLKNDTRAQHQDAENRPIEQAMAKGTLEPDKYAQLLGQRWLVHRHLESLLDEAVTKEPRLAPFVNDDHKLGPIARADLIRFGIDPDEIQPLQATTKTNAQLTELADVCPIALLGPHYVFEGSKNGGRFIARSLLKAWGPDYLKRLSYLDPHGDEQSALWKQFCEAMNELKINDDELQRIVDAAAFMFDGVARIDDELSQQFKM